MSNMSLVLRVALGLLVTLLSVFAFLASLWLTLDVNFRFLSPASIPVLIGMVIGSALAWMSLKLIAPPLRLPNA